MHHGWLKPKEIRFQHVSESSKADVYASQFQWQIVPDSRSGNSKVSVAETVLYCCISYRLAFKHHLLTYLLTVSPSSHNYVFRKGLLPAGRRPTGAALLCSIEALWMAACFCCTSSWASRCICSIVLGLFFSRRGTQLFCERTHTTWRNT